MTIKARLSKVDGIKGVALGARVEGEVVKSGERDVVGGSKGVFGMEVLKEIRRSKV